MTSTPNATDITVLETEHKLDGEFAAMAMAVENGEFALWIGSGVPTLPLSRMGSGHSAVRVPGCRQQLLRDVVPGPFHELCDTARSDAGDPGA